MREKDKENKTDINKERDVEERNNEDKVRQVERKSAVLQQEIGKCFEHHQ